MMPSKKKKIIGNITDEHRSKTPQQNSSKQNPTTCYKDHTLYRKGLYPGVQGFFNIHSQSV